MHKKRESPAGMTAGTLRGSWPESGGNNFRRNAMKFGMFTMPSHPPERGLKEGHDFDLMNFRWLDELGYE